MLVVNDLGLEQTVDFPTKGQNILDTFFTNQPSLINLCKPVPGIGDHTIVFTKYDVTINDWFPMQHTLTATSSVS
jgi:hypothetical protein